MKLFVLVLSICCLSAQSNDITTVYIVRHAEKEINSSRNPELTKNGKERATKLRNILKNVAISAIYSTDYIRTQETVQPTAESKKINITSYHPFKPKAMIKDIFENHIGKSVLISGHSNTVSKTIVDLGGEKIPDLDESEYSNLFILTIIKLKNTLKTRLQKLTY